MPAAVLVPVDGSTFAEHALPYAVGISRSTGAALHLALVHVPVEIMRAHPMADHMEARFAEERTREGQYLDLLATRLAAAGVDARPALLHGGVTDVLSAYAEEQAVDLVVMTTHGRGGLQRAWLGSTADGMVRHCPAPILLIRPEPATRDVDPAAAGGFRRILAALDGSEAAERALLAALDLGVTGDAAVILAHVAAPLIVAVAPYLPEPAQLTPAELAAREDRMRRYLAEVAARQALAGRSVETRVVRDYETARAVLDLADEVDADLIALGTHGWGGLRRIVLGSVADKVIRGTTRAVLVHRGERTGADDRGGHRRRARDGAAPASPTFS